MNPMVLMLGWEYPPHINGGLGVACDGLTRALSALGARIDFVVPRLHGDERARHMRIWDPLRLIETRKSRPERVFETSRMKALRGTFFLSPYLTRESYAKILAKKTREKGGKKSAARAHYGPDLFSEIDRYTAALAEAALSLDFDLVHAHDWMTFGAGVLIARSRGVPLVAHVHSLEYDRAGGNGNPEIVRVEREGLRGADRIIAVSEYTRGLIHRVYGVPLEKIETVHNGASAEPLRPEETAAPYRKRRIVLFLGRLTFQKGPDYFVEAAARVIPHAPDALFVVAGSGDMLPRLIERVHRLGLERHFHFAGFLKGAEVRRMFDAADLYVMPSVSEPFGLTALEAARGGTPVIVSKQAGVSEVMRHALRADFWDVDRLADLMLASLKYSALRQDIVPMARREVRGASWEKAAEKVLGVYRRLAAAARKTNQGG